MNTLILAAVLAFKGGDDSPRLDSAVLHPQPKRTASLLGRVDEPDYPLMLAQATPDIPPPPGPPPPPPGEVAPPLPPPGPPPPAAAPTAPIAPAPPPGNDYIRTKDGRGHTGTILRETERGYLFRENSGETFVIEFGMVDDIKSHWRGGGAPSGGGTQLEARVSRRLMLESRMRDLRQQELYISFSRPITEILVTLVTFALIWFLFPDPLILLLGLITGGITILIATFQLGYAVWQKATIDKEIESIQREMATLGAREPGPLPGVVLARF